MKRSKRLRRRARLEQRSRKPKLPKQPSAYKARVRLTAYMLGVKELPCCARIVPGHVCDGPVEADHAGKKPGASRKAHDSTVIPLCKLAHVQRDSFSGPFRSWDHDMMRGFLDDRILHTRRMMAERGFVLSNEDCPPIVITCPPPTFPISGVVTVYGNGRSASAELERADVRAITNTINRLTEDIREVGNVDVRNPASAPIASEGAHDR